MPASAAEQERIAVLVADVAAREAAAEAKRLRVHEQLDAEQAAVQADVAAIDADIAQRERQLDAFDDLD